LISGIFNLIDGALIQQQKFETISNNLANINTNGFKKDVVSFKETLTMAISSETDFSPGQARYTGNKLDVALGAKGFFKIDTPNGIRYTRNGSFTINADGVLVTQNGNTVLGQNGPIHIIGNKVTIGSDGQIAVDNEPAGKLLIADFEKPRFLKKEGGSYYVYQGDDSGISTADDVIVRQDYLESSNVNPTEEMIKMIETNRVFESLQKAISSIDQASKEMINVYGTIQ
jgi:flagellar basal-body rod protein FlgG